MGYTHKALLGLNGEMTLISFVAEPQNMELIVGENVLITRNPALFFKELGKGFEELGKISQSDEKGAKKVHDAADRAIGIDYSRYLLLCRHEIGYFLVELMRVCNLTLHDKNVLKGFRKKFESMQMPWIGQPDDCIEQITFKDLKYVNKADGTGFVRTEI